MEVILARPRGFCAGVIRAIEAVENALDLRGQSVYVLHEIVHNRHVVEDLRSRGARFVEELEEIPRGSVAVFSAHGVSKSVAEQAKRRRLRVIDATCPLVTRVHRQAQRYSSLGMEVIIIGHPGHPEVEGTRGRIDGLVHVLSTPSEAASIQVGNPHRLAYVTQTTLSIDDTRHVIEALKRRFPTVKGPNLSDICYATQSRQKAVMTLAGRIELLWVVGSRNSSNSNRLRETAELIGLPSYLIEDAEDIRPEWFDRRNKIGVTAGASAPELLVRGVLERLRELGEIKVMEMAGEPETTHFRLPDEPLPIVKTL